MFVLPRVFRRYLGLAVWNSLREWIARSLRAGRGLFSGRATVETWDWRRNGPGMRICANERLMAAAIENRRVVTVCAWKNF